MRKNVPLICSVCDKDLAGTDYVEVPFARLSNGLYSDMYFCWSCFNIYALEKEEAESIPDYHARVSKY